MLTPDPEDVAYDPWDEINELFTTIVAPIFVLAFLIDYIGQPIVFENGVLLHTTNKRIPIFNSFDTREFLLYSEIDSITREGKWKICQISMRNGDVFSILCPHLPFLSSFKRMINQFSAFKESQVTPQG